MHLTRLGKKSFKLNCYFQAEIQIDDSKLRETVINWSMQKSKVKIKVEKFDDSAPKKD